VGSTQLPEDYLIMKEALNEIKDVWLSAWNNKAFRNHFIVGVLLLVAVMVTTSYFFNYIQDDKNGIELNDWVLKRLPSIDVSVFIVTLMLSSAALFALRGLSNPNMLMTFLFALIIHLIARMITISATQFFPPQGLIVLHDPMGSMLYQYRFISRDLFYSGHTAILSLLYFCSFKKLDKYYIMLTVIGVGFLLLVQHVHYTIDVLCAPLFAFGCFWLAKKLINSREAYIDGLESHLV